MACWTRRKAVSTQLYKALAATLRPATEQLVAAWKEHDPQNLTDLCDVAWAYETVLNELEAKIDPTAPEERRQPCTS